MKSSIDESLNIRQGWTNRITSNPIIRLKSTIEVSKLEMQREYASTEIEDIKRNLSWRIAEDIIKHINIVKIEKPENNTIMFEADINVVQDTTKISEYLMSKEQFMWSGRVWSQNEILKALEYAYPQYSI